MVREKKAVVVTPVPYPKVAILGLILSANNTSIWMIFSFLPFMVQFYFPLLSKTELGFRAGLLGSAFSAGSLFGNLIWGVVSDRMGRRPTLMLGLFGTAISALIFGFAPNFACAVAARFLWGLLNGNIGVAKTYLGEISDDTNAAKGMALFGVIGGFGRTIGPVIGGFLSSPAKAYPSTFQGTVFETYPFALPSIVISLYCVVVLVVSFFTLSETLPPNRIVGLCGDSAEGAYSLLAGKEDKSSHNNVNNTGVEMAEINKSMDEDELEEFGLNDKDAEVQLIPDNKRSKRSGGLSSGSTKGRLTFNAVVKVKEIDTPIIEYKPLKGVKEHDVPVDNDNKNSNNSKVGHVSDYSNQSATDVENADNTVGVVRYSNGSEEEYVDHTKRSFLGQYWYLLSQRGVFISTLMYGTNALTTIVINEVFPLWVVTSKAQGGFQFNEHKIGISTMICGMIAIVLQISLYPMLVERVGILRTYKIAVAAFALGCFLTPAASLTTGLGFPFLEWASIIFTQLILAVTSTWVLISVFVLINNSAYSYQRATVNSIGQTFASLGRLCGPYFGAVIFAWSENNKMMWPFDYYLVFYLLAIIGVGNWMLCNMLPYSIQRRKREPVIPSDEAVEEMLRRTAPQRPEDISPPTRAATTKPYGGGVFDQSFEEEEVGSPMTHSPPPKSKNGYMSLQNKQDDAEEDPETAFKGKVRILV